MITSNGIELAPYQFNADTANTIIALHGIGGSTNSFAPQASLGHSELNFIAWNMPGYGASPGLQITSFEALADALMSVINELHLNQVHLMGHSIGGMVALEVAARHPDRIASLALLGTTSAFGGRDDTFKKQFLDARLAPLEAGQSMHALARQFVPEIIGSNPNPDAIANAVESMQAVPVDTYKAIMSCLVTFNRRESLAELTMPCCLIAGSEDTNAPAATMHKMADKISNSSFHVIESAGHLLNLEHPQATNSLLQHFYQEIIQS